MTSYPTAQFRRPALAPGLLAAVVLVAGAGFAGAGTPVWITYVISVLAIIVAYFSLQARQWWWLIVLVPIAIAWNPVFPFAWAGPVWLAAQFVAAVLFLSVGALVKVDNPDDRNRRR